MANSIEELLVRVFERHRAFGRSVSEYFEISYDAERLSWLDDKGIFVPNGLRELYGVCAGIECGDSLNMWESNVFLQFDFTHISLLKDLTESAPSVDPGNPEGVIRFSNSPFGASGNLIFNPPNKENNEHIWAALYPLSSQCHVAFDSVETMLLTTLRAYERKLVKYDNDGKIDFDFGEFCDHCGELNPYSDYWEKMRDQTLDWEVDGFKFPNFENSKWG